VERLEDCFSFLIGKAAQQVTRRTRELLAPFGVTPVQYATLYLLWRRDGLSAAQLGAVLILDSATMTGVIDRLEAAALIERRADPSGDRRISRIYLTLQGAALKNPLNKAVAQLNAEIGGKLGRDSARVWEGLKRLGEAEVPAARGKRPRAAVRRAD
jgi:DNA-binding MarR family transcriptional regulator